ncbi:hypothetical protein C488_08937 [Natrinema pellirubrum DSM 15624]|uniref:Membrane protein n=1 Tax=Natrinema pellirubrum (strain DSM 15624 / CIP 106293 / JCM 10476 / NCIMB 786 / 157) TaxID=797303 RepID=L0JMJ8_NATP1|nr:DUF2243 domain-containing protein [Natrinema pellirubrum]AGB32760.1 putative membrane protein [Natrinema pellirubrum DSM 15624]ELY75763.1 hypothetical protein C488_08937 [Natrinema pellirubrum DSM 15624]
MADRNGTWLGLDAAAKPLVIAGLALGIGLGGFFDGIVFHQILQIHNMLSSYPDASVATDLELNVMADGIFHLATYTFTIMGVVLLFRAWRLPSVPGSGRTLLGASIMGWGAFNVVEGLVDHQLLGLHHVWPAGPGPLLLWDMLFLLWGLLFLGGGYLVIRTDGVAAATAGDEAVAADGRGPE